MLRGHQPGQAYLPAAWSADERYLLYYHDPEHSASVLNDGVPLYAIPLHGGTPHRLAASTFVGELALSPDGRQVAVSEGMGREAWKNRLLVVTHLHNGARHMLNNASTIAISPAWSPRDTTLAWVSAPAAPTITQPGDAQPALQTRRIVLQSPGGAIHTLLPRDSVREEDPQWSADGSKLLFTQITPEGQASLCLSAPESETQQTLVERISPDEVRDVHWDGYYGMVEWPMILDWWRGQHTAAPAWEQGDNTHVPVRALIEALGGSVSPGIGRDEFIVTLDGATHHFTVNSDAETPARDFWRYQGVIYAPLSFLGDFFTWSVSWNAAAREIVLTDTRGGRIAILPLRPYPALRASRPGVHALLHLTSEESYVVGGMADGRYFDDTEMADYLHAGERYRVYRRDGQHGTCRAGRPADANDGAEGKYVNVTPPVRKEAYALNAAWNAMPASRAIRRGDPQKPVYQRLAQQILAAHGLRDTPPRVTEAYTGDLDGDGQQEQIISASCPAVNSNDDDYFAFQHAGEYSFIAVRKGGHDYLLTGAFFPTTPPKPKENSNPEAYTISAFLDVTGDGVQEISSSGQGYEWQSIYVYRFAGGRVDELYRCFVGEFRIVNLELRIADCELRIGNWELGISPIRPIRNSQFAIHNFERIIPHPLV